MNVTPNYYAKGCSLNQNLSKNVQASPSFGHIYDYYDPDEIKEAVRHDGVFREPGEDSFSYEERARKINEAWERQDRERNERKWWQIF